MSDGRNDEMKMFFERKKKPAAGTEAESPKWVSKRAAGLDADGPARGTRGRPRIFNNATFQKYGTSAWDQEVNTLNETMTYDANGNIATLERNQNQRGLSGTTVTSTAQTIDNLTYTYLNNANQLKKVDDGATSAGFNDGTNQATEYTYDTHGNLTQDLNKGISNIAYNALGKAQQITFSDGRVISYTYDAGGNKLKMATTVSGTTTTTEYANGYVYNTSSTDNIRKLAFFSSPEGRVVKNSGGNYDYQYAIADHQGNTRIVFTSATPTAQAVTATFEGDSNDQSSQFSNVNAIPFGSANHTSGGSRVVRLSQAAPVGPGYSKAVYPGDKVDMEAYSYYEASSNYGTTNVLVSSMISAVSGALINGLPDAGGMKSSGVNSALGGFGIGPNQGDNAPAAFLNYILFDQSYKVMDAGWQVITPNAFSKERVGLPQITVKEAGFIFVYLSYDNQSSNFVYFDDFKVTVTPTNIIQSSEFYPFGLQTSNSWTRENTSNNFLYDAGSELNSTSGMYDLPFRNYDASLGRFFQVDELAIISHTMTPYHYAGNDPIRFNDPSGLDKQDPWGFSMDGTPNWVRYRRDQMDEMWGWDAGGGAGGNGGAAGYWKTTTTTETKEETVYYTTGPETRIYDETTTKLEYVYNPDYEPEISFNAPNIGVGGLTQAGVMITVTGQKVGNGLVYSYPYKTYDADGNLRTYKVPYYKVIVTGTDADGNSTTREFSALRFGVNVTATTSASVVGISDAQGPYDLQSSSRYGGSWQVIGLYNDAGVENYFVHIGPSNVNAVTGAIGCVEILGGRAAMNDFNSFIGQYSGPVQINYEYAAQPDLIFGRVVKSH